MTNRNFDEWLKIVDKWCYYEKKKDNQQYYISHFSMCLRTGNDLSAGMDGNEFL